MQMHEQEILRLKDRLSKVQRLCEHDYKDSSPCSKCGMRIIDSFNREPINLETYIKYATKLKTKFLESGNFEGLHELRILLRDNNFVDSTLPTIDEL